MEITLPQWLDTLIFDELGAKYSPSYSDMTNIDDDKEKTLNYLGTYFPRSYAESYCIFSEYFRANNTYLSNKEQLSIFDFGSGTGGEIIGLLTLLNEQFPNLKLIKIVALDGNQNALQIYEKILKTLQMHIDVQIENNSAPIHIDDFYDLHVLDKVMNKRFDIIMSFKAICEFVTKEQFERQNAYEHIAKFLTPKIKEDGILLFEDVTTYNNTSQEWLPIMMDKGLMLANCVISKKNEGYNQTYFISHSHKTNDKSKVAWRLINK